jgi:hypothetical protein
MAQTGFTPISIYYSSTATNVPTAGNLVAGELAINTADGKLFYKDSSNVVQVIGTKGGVGSSSTTQVLYNSSGLVVGSANMVFNGSTLTTLNSAYTGTLTGGTGVIAIGTNQIYKDASGLVGIGCTPVANLQVNASSDVGVAMSNSSSVTSGNRGTLSMFNSSNSSVGYIRFGAVTDNVGTNIQFATRPVGGSLTEAMRIDSSGNVGIGRTPDQRLQIAQSSAVEFDMFVGTTRTLSLYADATQAILAAPTAIPMIFKTTDITRVQINSGGDLLVGTTATTAHNAAGFTIEGDGVPFVTRGVAGTFMGFYNTTNATLIGYISNVAGTATAYNTTSDYRLKENVAPMANALATVSLLKPCTYKWKSNGENGQGFIAHELQEVVAGCVTGEKDAVETVDELDEDGKVIGTKEIPKYQGIDTSFLVATLTAAIQELNAKVDAQAVEIASLKAK